MCLYSSVEALKQKKHDEQKKMNRRKVRKKYKASPDWVFCGLKQMFVVVLFISRIKTQET